MRDDGCVLCGRQGRGAVMCEPCGRSYDRSGVPETTIANVIWWAARRAKRFARKAMATELAAAHARIAELEAERDQERRKAERWKEVAAAHKRGADFIYSMLTDEQKAALADAELLSPDEARSVLRELEALDPEPER